MRLIGGLTKTEIRKINLDDIVIRDYHIDVIEHLAETRYSKSDSFWYIVNTLYDFSEDFMRKFEDLVDSHSMDYFIQFQELSEGFMIRNFGFSPSTHYRHWVYVSRYQELSEDFIRRYSEHLEWPLLCNYQNMSEEFMIEFIDKVSIGSFEEVMLDGRKVIAELPGIIHNEEIPEDVCNRIRDLKVVLEV